MSVPKLRRFGRPISVSAVLAGSSIDIWRSCRFLGATSRALGGLLGGLGRFLPAWAPITVDSGLLVGRGVVMVLRLGLWRLLMLVFWMTYFLSLVTQLGLVGPLLMVLSGCGTVPFNFLYEAYLEAAAFWWCGCIGCCGCGPPAGSWFAGL